MLNTHHGAKLSGSCSFGFDLVLQCVAEGKFPFLMHHFKRTIKSLILESVS